MLTVTTIFIPRDPSTVKFEPIENPGSFGFILPNVPKLSYALLLKELSEQKQLEMEKQHKLLIEKLEKTLASNPGRPEMKNA